MLRTVLQSAADLLISMLAGGKHTEIKEGVGPYGVAYNCPRNRNLTIIKQKLPAGWSGAFWLAFFNKSDQGNAIGDEG